MSNETSHLKIAVVSDHRGYECKRKVVGYLKGKGYAVADYGCDSPTACDYPDFAVRAAEAIAAGSAECAILLDSSGIGMSVCANKFPGVRAAVVHDEVMARVARDANHCNALCLGTDLLSQDLVLKIVEAFITTPFSAGRHIRRIEKIAEIERRLHSR